MSSLFPASRPVLGALALASALLLSACAGEAPEATGAADAAAGSGTSPSAAAPAETGPATGTGDATEPAGAGTGEQTGEQPGDRSPTEPAESRAADAPPEGPAAAGGGSAGDGTDGGGTNGADADENGTAAGGGTAGARTGGGAPLCTTSQLEAAAAPVGGAAGSVHVDLVLTNAGGSPCTLAGYAGVSLVDAAGTMIGSPAVRDAAVPGAGRVVAPGESVSAGLRVSQAGNYPTCDARTASGLRVYPPENTESVVIPFPVEACGDPQIHQLEIQGFGA
ncbi:DUF4232 domain-containing protein [uncultured Kocuria sp.]|uniref:DUF4232 domain-containing protein n=1 Tax=uncultured Kocuria sp. TaxID=259305 RepID=UPI0026373384|nr:DUF4232 domain-containing protein [uncultured Kocuria sp.]